MASLATPPIPRLTAGEMLACLDAGFAELAAAFVRGDYVLWLGSGLSRDVVPEVPSLLQNLLSHLQVRADVTDDGCRFARALNEVLGISGLPAEDRADMKN